MSIGLQLIASYLKEKENALDLFRVPEDLFTPDEVPVFQYVKKHSGLSGALPHPDTIKTELGTKMPKVIEPSGYYLDRLKRRYQHNGTAKMLFAAEDLIKNEKVGEALSMIMERTVKLLSTLKHESLYDFQTTGSELVMAEYIRKLQMGSDYGVQLGWETLDHMVGGLVPGDVLAIIGRPAQGKTYCLLSAAHHAWYEQGKDVLVVSPEMKPLPILQRLTAMHLHAPITELKHSEFQTAALKKFKKDIYGIKSKTGEGNLWVIDGSAARTVPEILSYASVLGVDAAYVDGAYLIQGSNPRAARWEKVTETIEAMKNTISQDAGIPVACSYQFNREVKKKKADEGKDVGIEDIAGADAIGQTASIVLGLFDTESIETLSVKRVRILKDREGPRGEFLINWIFDSYPMGTSMNFSEMPKEEFEQKQKQALGYV